MTSSMQAPGTCRHGLTPSGGLRLLTLGTHLLHFSRLFLLAEAARFRNRRCFCLQNSMVKKLGSAQVPGFSANPCEWHIVEQTEWMRIIPGSLDHNLTKTNKQMEIHQPDNRVFLRATNQQNLVSFTPPSETSMDFMVQILVANPETRRPSLTILTSHLWILA